METTDILIAGGGIAGLAAAARLGADGRRVTVVDPAPETDGETASGARDLRTTAYLTPGIETLTRAGVWDKLTAAAAPLTTMRLVDAGGRERHVRERADFVASELQDAPFGWNVANSAMRAALRARIAEMDSVRLIAGESVTARLPRTGETILTLSRGQRIAAQLAIGADGRDSTLRRLAGIGARRWSYGQVALVFAVGHGAAMEGVSTEIHRTGGPLTLVPMPDIDGQHRSAVVWMAPVDRGERLMALSAEALATEITAETMGLFGPLTVETDRAVWPIIGQIAHRLRDERLALVAEAAHVIPPIGAQGLNMSLADIECLARLVEGAGAGDIGADTLLAAYERRRMPEIAARVTGVHVLNRFAQAEPQPIRDLRLAGLRAISRIGPVRRFAMRAGLGTSG